MNKTSTKWVVGHKITPYETTGDYDLIMGETPAKMQGPPPHLHRTYKEMFLMVEGEMEFMVNGEIKVYKEGESLVIPPNTLHTFTNRSNSSCKWINIHSPKGFYDFFETLGVSANDPNAQEKSLAPEVIEEVIRTAGSYDMIIKM